MNPETQNRIQNLSPKKIAAISVVTFFLLTLAITIQVTYAFLNDAKIPKGVYINDTYVGGLTPSEVTNILKRDYQDKASGMELVIQSKNSTEKILYSDIGLTFDIPGSIDKALNIGKSGNLFERMQEIFKTSRDGIKITMPFTYNKDKLQKSVDSLYEKTLINVKEADLFIQSDKMSLRSGHHGEYIDKVKTIEEIENYFKACKAGNPQIPINQAPPKKIDLEEYYKKITQEAKDATVKVENNNVTVIPHIVGTSIDKSSLASIISELEKNENSEKVLPVTFIQPKLVSTVVSSKIFKDTLGSMSTQFFTSNQNDKNRGENIRIAVSKINAKILGVGEVFSFNNIVGPRDEQGGYKVAHTYVGGKIVDGIGGGICQVSTTLYNAVLFSDLDVTDRTNHMFTVSYVPFGRDAAVAYGQVDFKFKNSTNWPIKIEASVTSDNKINFAIKGTNESPGKTITFKSETKKTFDFTEKYVDDPTLPEGTTSIVTEGMKGYLIDTFKIIKKDGKVVNESKISTSNYIPLDREIKKGVKKDSQEAAQAKLKSTPGVDEAANPPAKPTP